MFHYQLNPSSPIGKQFIAALADGVNAEREADKLVKECNAVGCVPDLYSDFGGITAFAFRKNVKPDPEVFLDSEQTTKDGCKLYEPNVKITQKVYVWEKMPADDPYIIKSKRELKFGELMFHVPRKMIAEALNTELKYMHPLEALTLLGVNKEKVAEYALGKKTMRETLQGLMVVSKRDKMYREYAIEGDKEERVFREEAEKHTYGLCSFVNGNSKAAALFCECQALPVVPQGTLNRLVGLGAAKKRCGFFVYKNWIWVRSSDESVLEVNDDWKKVTKKLWEENCKEAKKLYQEKGEKK